MLIAGQSWHHFSLAIMTKALLVLICVTIACVLDRTAAINGTINATSPTSTKNCSNEKFDLKCISETLNNEQSSIHQLLIVTTASGIWAIYLAFYNSRLIAFIITKVINQFYKDAYIHFGSISISVLSGKFMFRDLLYITTDYSLRVQDGYAIFRWWRPYDFKSFMKRKDLDQGHTRLSVYISSFDCHVYNRSEVYDRLNELFGVKTSSAPKKEDGTKKAETEIEDKIPSWRALLPVIKFFISSGRLTFGNRLMPSTLIASFSEGDVQYKTTKASNKYDLFMHVVEAKFNSFKVTLAPSLGYNRSATPAMLRIIDVHNEPPPRKMGDGFALIQSNDVHLNYVWDEPGRVPRDLQEEDDPLPTDGDGGDSPQWEMNMRFGKGTTISYGPWADRQRELLWKFFFPPDYQRLKVTEKLQPGQRRAPEMFRFSSNVSNNADIDILFTKHDKVSALQMNILKGSSVEVEIPMVVKKDGYTSLISGRLLFLNTTTNLPFQNILKSETLSFKVTSHYPLQWNASQTWNCDITATEASLTFLFAHKNLIADLMDDWSAKSPPDIMSFVPYVFSFRISLHDFELILPCNAYNWIDCSFGSKAKENAYVGIHGKKLEIKFDLPFDDFLPPTFSVPFTYELQRAELCVFLPGSNPARNLLLGMASNFAKWNDVQEVNDTHLLDPDSEISFNVFDAHVGKDKKWGMISDDDWVKCWTVPSLSLTLTYTWHPVVVPFTETPMKATHATEAKYDGKWPSTQTFTTSSVESLNKRPGGQRLKAKSVVTFDPTSLEADEIRIDLKMASGSNLLLYGSLLDLLLALKENYFGYDDMFSNFVDGVNLTSQDELVELAGLEEASTDFRPLQVTLDVILNDITAVLPVYPTPVLGKPPTLKLGKLMFEMDKNYHQTRLQLLLSDLSLDVSDRIKRPEADVGMETGHGRVHLHDLQLRGHAMFSGNGLSIGATCIEYAWLTEVLVGTIKGKLSVPQVQTVVGWAETFVFLLKNEDHQLKKAFPNRILPTGISWEYRKKDGQVLSETDVKYLMMRLRLEDIQLRVVEGSSLVDITVSPVTVANGNVQERGILEAVSVVAEQVAVRHRVMKDAASGEWLDAGEICFGPLISQVTMATDEYEMNTFQEDFLKFHDRKTRRLDFLWENSAERSAKRSPGVTSLLDSVRGMKAWGCSFFTPLTCKHPTFYYSKQHRLDEEHEGLKSEYFSSSDDWRENNGHRGSSYEEDVFDSELDYGMSLLSPGKRLLIRTRRKIVTSANDDVVDEIHVVNEAEPVVMPDVCVDGGGVKIMDPKPVVPAGRVLMSGLRASNPVPKTLKIPDGNGGPKVDRGSRDDDRAPPDESAPEISRKPMLARSTESNLYCSAESDLKSVSSFSSDDYFSAESDVEEHDSDKKKTFKSESSVTSSTSSEKTSGAAETVITIYSDDPLKEDSPEADDDPLKEDSLGADDDPLKEGSPEADDDIVEGIEGRVRPYLVRLSGSTPISPQETWDGGRHASTSSRPGSLSFGRRKSDQESSGSKTTEKHPHHPPLEKRLTIVQSHQLMHCYSNILPTSVVRSCERDDFMSEFEEIREGIHPSVIVKSFGGESNLKRRHSVDVLHQADDDKFKSTNVNVHVKGSLQVQVSPFLLETTKQMLDAACLTVAWQPPLQILSNIRRECATDAASIHRVEIARAKKVADDREGQIAPGFQVHVMIDDVCVNFVQATVGEDAVFNLSLNKLLPTPSISVLSLRLDEVDLGFELNSKHNKLLSKILTKQRKISSVSNKSTDSKSVLEKAYLNGKKLGTQGVLFDFIGHVSVDSLDAQLRVMSEDGNLPVRSCVTALSDEACKADFSFQQEPLLRNVASSIKKFQDTSAPAHNRLPPPKTWGWVTIESGCRNVVANVVKQSSAECLMTEEGTREDVAAEDAASSHDSPDQHVCNAALNVDLVWLNVVAPPSQAQALKSSRTVRAWNLLTSIAPSVSAWLDPGNQMNLALDRFEKQNLTRKCATACAALVVALETLMPKRDLCRKLWEAKKHRYDVMADASKSIREDPSFRLCDVTLQLFLDAQRLQNLDVALADSKYIPVIATLEQGFQILTVQWSEFVRNLGSESSGKVAKKSSVHHEPSYGNMGSGVRFDGELDIVSFRKQQPTVSPPTNFSTQERKRHGDAPLTPDQHDQSHQDTPPVQGSPLRRHILERLQSPNAAQEVVYEQQQSMYSWMQNQTSDLEAQNERASPVDGKMSFETSLFIDANSADLNDENFQFAQEMFDNFINHVGMRLTTDTKPSTSLVQKHCNGSLMIQAHLKTLKIDKQKPDPFYTRESVYNKRRSSMAGHHSMFRRRHQVSGHAPPILLIQGITFKSSIADTVIKEKGDGDDEKAENSEKNGSKKKGKSQNTNNSGLLQTSSWSPANKPKSTLSLQLELSVKHVTQRVDIALVRLVHQFIQCSDAIQQAQTDILVNRYTEGSVSPDPMSSHRRTASNVTNMSGYSLVSDIAPRSSMFKRHPSQASGHRRFNSLLSDIESASSSSTTSEELALCWQFMYKLIDKYSATSGHSVLRSKSFTGTSAFHVIDERGRGLSSPARPSGSFIQQPYLTMRISAALNVKQIQLLAEFGKLKLSTVVSDLGMSASHTQSSLVHLKQAKSDIKADIARVEGSITEHTVSKKTVVTCEVASSHLEASTCHKRDCDVNNTCSLVVGQIVIDLPQHPASLHAVVSRGTKQLSNHIEEFAKTPTYRSSFDVVDGFPTVYPADTPSTVTFNPSTPMTPSAITAIIDLSQGSSEVTDLPVVLRVSATVQGIEATVNLLPSLRASYSTIAINGEGKTGPDAEFSVKLEQHSLQFASEPNDDLENEFVPTVIPLPPIHGTGELKSHVTHSDEPSNMDVTGDQVGMKYGEYLAISIHVGSFEHILSTDLFNQLVFFHGVFMNEISDVIKKMSRDGDSSNQRSETSIRSDSSTRTPPILYQLQLQLEGIRITATTPSSNAVQLKTGTIIFELSNQSEHATPPGKRQKNIPKYLKMFGKARVDLTLALGTLVANSVYPEAEAEFQQMSYFTTRLGLQNTSQQSRESAPLPFSGSGLSPPSNSTMGGEKTLQDNNVVLIDLNRPIFIIQPTAFDKAILIFLAYKHAYEDWVDQRADHENVRRATKQVVSAIQSRRSHQAGGNVVTSNLFLQLSVHDLGICLPTVQDTNQYDLSIQDELSSAVVLTVEKTLISACYAKSLVTRGQFSGFCVRFANDFQISWDDWRPTPVPIVLGPGLKSHVVMNSLIVPEGTYEICTDTSSQQDQLSTNVHARTCVDIHWRMEGMDVQLDTKIGANLSHLTDTLTLIAGQDELLTRDSSASGKFQLGSQSESLTDIDVTSPGDSDVTDGPSRDRHFFRSRSEATSQPEVTWKERTKQLEQDLNKQVLIVNDLRLLGAKPSLIEEQEQKLHSLEASLSTLFRKSVRNKLRRSGSKTQEPMQRPRHQRSLSQGVQITDQVPAKSAKSAYATLPGPRSSRNDFWIGSSPLNDQVFSLPTKVVEEPSDETFAEESSENDDDDVVDANEPRVRRSLYLDESMQSSQGRNSFLHSQMAGNEIDADLELILDIRVEIDGGKIVCHPLTQNQAAGSDKSVPLKQVGANRTTTFFVPGVDIKFHYNSETQMSGQSENRHQEFFTPPDSPKINPNGGVPNIEVNTPGGSQAFKSRSGGSRACVYTWFTVQSLPEMVISPYFLDFLEQTLNVLPVTPSPSDVTKSGKSAAAFHSLSDDENEETNPDPLSSVAPPGSSDTFNTTIASLPVDVVVFIHVHPSQVLFNCQPLSRVECLLHIPSLDLVFSSVRDSPPDPPASTFAFPDKAISTGLSFTAIMSDFSIYVFHPYGAQQHSLDGCDQLARNDSLSVNLQVVKVNIVRTRKGVSSVAMETSGISVPKQFENNEMQINLSVLVDMDRASFKYDMRRLSEILAFPRAWYRRSIAKRLFFGETHNDSMQHSQSSNSGTTKPKSPPRSDVGILQLLQRDSPLTSRRSLNQNHSGVSINSERDDAKRAFPRSSLPWHGVILFGLNMTRLDVEMNMSNVMGNTVWSCDGLMSDGKLSFHSSGDKDIRMSCSLENSHLSAKSGIIGGMIDLSKLQANCHLFDPENGAPVHNITVKVHSLDGRIEYMGGCVMIGRLTSSKLKLADEWKETKLSGPGSPSKKPVSVFVPGDMSWDAFYLIISRSTTPDVVKMLAKLEEFFTQQLRNSVRAFTSLGQSIYNDVMLRRQASVVTQAPQFNHHRHWPPVFTAISETFRTLGAAIVPQFLLGGSFCLHGNELTVVCFHGTNFRSRSWVLFNILEPNIVFSTEVQEIKESIVGTESSTLAIQSLTFNLGHDYWLKTGGPSTDPMATVSRVTSSQQKPPPSAAPIDEWFAYVTASRTQELNMLRTLNDISMSEDQRSQSASPNSRRISSSSQSAYKHETEIIFALPKLQLDFKTEHMQGPDEPNPEDESNYPQVDCSFVTEFTDHICVTMDVELIMFLHDLVSSYLKEKQQSLSSRNRKSSISGAHSSVHSSDHVTSTVDPIDLRRFVCNTWQLEPTVRLISWAGRRIEPVGVDYILQKLGFKHARTTIPKWFQRGVLDVLDQTLALIVQNLVVHVTNQKHKK